MTPTTEVLGSARYAVRACREPSAGQGLGGRHRSPRSSQQRQDRREAQPSTLGLRGMALPIEDYAMIGDRRTAALVGTNGSVDWLCLPDFDSAACLAGLLGTDDHGHWQLVPDGRYTTERRYVGASAVLETSSRPATGGHADRPDAALRRPLRPDPQAQGRQRDVRMRHEWRVRLDYGLVRPWVRRATHRRRAGDHRGRGAGPPGAARPAVAEGGRRHLQRRVRRQRGRRAGVLDDVVPVVRRAQASRRPHAPIEAAIRRTRSGRRAAPPTSPTRTRYAVRCSP